MKTISYSILFSTLCVTLFFSCCKKDDTDPCKGYPSQTFQYNISDINKSKIPYLGTETLSFIDNLGDTAKLTGTGKLVYTDSYSKFASSNPDCGNQIYLNFENIRYTFNGNNIDLNNIDYHLYLRFAGTDYVAPDSSDDNDYISITCNGQVAKNTFTYANREANYTDSVYIDGTYYKGAIINTGILYNYHYGLLRVQLNGKT